VDVLVQCTNALLGLLVLCLAPRLPHAGTFLAAHAAYALTMFVLIKFDHGHPRVSDPLTILRYWLPTCFVLILYFELGFLVPTLRDYSDYRYDRVLQAIDIWLMGDPEAFIRGLANTTLSDVLTVCYFAFYPLTLILPALLFVRGAFELYQRVAAIILMAFLLSYVGYVIFPALGPHRLFDVQRPPELDGFGLSRAGYQWLRGIPNEPPDAFPSGHALIAMLVPALAWRWQRTWFWWLAPFGLGIVLSTIYLRLHYVTDVVASVVIAPIAWKLGSAVARRFPMHASRTPVRYRASPGPVHDSANLET